MTFAAISVLTNLARCVQEHILSLMEYVADGVGSRKPSQQQLQRYFYVLSRHLTQVPLDVEFVEETLQNSNTLDSF